VVSRNSWTATRQSSGSLRSTSRGGTLEARILDFRGNAPRALTAFRSLVQTTAELHKDNVFHRDIKPANIFIGADGRLILGDFGIAFLPNLPERLTFTGESVGPHDYMPPRAETEGQLLSVDGRFDVYELGKVLWCMVAGRLRLVREWHKRPAYDLTVVFPNDSQMHAINAILDKCLSENPDECLPDAHELLLVVDAHLSVMRRGGQMLREDVPRPCRVCGKGLYRLGDGQVHKDSTVLRSGSVTGGEFRNEGQSFLARFWVCDYCGNVELFRIL
jgi:serine/threonine protein kinase